MTVFHCVSEDAKEDLQVTGKLITFCGEEIDPWYDTYRKLEDFLTLSKIKVASHFWDYHKVQPLVACQKCLESEEMGLVLLARMPG